MTVMSNQLICQQEVVNDVPQDQMTWQRYRWFHDVSCKSAWRYVKKWRDVTHVISEIVSVKKTRLIEKQTGSLLVRRSSWSPNCELDKTTWVGPFLWFSNSKVRQHWRLKLRSWEGFVTWKQALKNPQCTGNFWADVLTWNTILKHDKFKFNCKTFPQSIFAQLRPDGLDLIIF